MRSILYNVKIKVVPLRTIKAAKRPDREQRNEVNSMYVHDERLLSVVARSASQEFVNLFNICMVSRQGTILPSDRILLNLS